MTSLIVLYYSFVDYNFHVALNFIFSVIFFKTSIVFHVYWILFRQFHCCLSLSERNCWILIFFNLFHVKFFRGYTREFVEICLGSYLLYFIHDGVRECERDFFGIRLEFLVFLFMVGLNIGQNSLGDLIWILFSLFLSSLL